VEDHSKLKQELCEKINGEARQEVAATSVISSPTAASWRDAWPTHEACSLVPPMPADELHALGEDIVKNDLVSPIVLWRASPDGQPVLLDGRSRLDGLELITGKPVEIDPPNLTCGDFIALDRVIVLDGIDPYTYAISANICRRNLTDEQRQNALIKLIARTPSKSDREIGKEAGVDHKTIAKARAKGKATGEVSPVEKRIGRDGKVRRRASLVKRAGSEPAASIPVSPQARIDELVHEVRIRDARILGLESELADLKAAAEASHQRADLASVWNDGTPSELAAGLAVIGADAVFGIMPSWRDKIIQQGPTNHDPLTTAFAGSPSTAQLIDLLERRLERDGLNASAQLRKIRALINSKSPTIDLKAMPAAGEA